MIPAEKDKLARLETVAKALKEAAAAAWAKGHLPEAAGLYLRADVAESRAHYFELAAVLSEDIDASELFKFGRPML